MPSIKNLHVSAENKEILKGINLDVHSGETHVIMGPNGAGKSTLAGVLAGKENYTITEGSITYEGKDLLPLSPEERAQAGIFLGFQYPVEIPGVSTIEFLKAAVNAKRQAQGKEPLDAIEFQALLQEKAAEMNMPTDLLERNLNEGFSGGEKKRNEIFQMALLEPKLKILDETDSGLDVDALKIVAQGIHDLHSADSATIVITHYNRILEFLDVDYVHIMIKGQIVKTGGKELAKEIEENGFETYLPKESLKVLN